MPFTVAETENIANSALDFFIDKGRATSQHIQDKPLLKAMNAAEEEFPGGKEFISGAVKGNTTSGIQGFTHDDEVGYTNPANAKRYNYPWKLIHNGIEFSMHECAKDGISIVDTTNGKGEVQHSERELTALVNILNEKFEDMAEGWDRGFNTMYWGDGSSDPNLVPGIKSFVVDTPTAGLVVGGIDQAANTWWRNRASLGISATDPTLQNVTTTLQKEYRQLRRYGGNPKLWIAGSDFIEALEKELRIKGSYTLDGFTSKGKTDTGMADISFKGNAIEYDPTLDDNGESKRLYVLDTRFIKPKVIAGESKKKHYPARPENKYMFFRAMTWMGGLICNKRNAHGVYSIA
ncbi:MAG: phage major capsid protein [Rhizomicrobium sp.]